MEGTRQCYGLLCKLHKTMCAIVTQTYEDWLLRIICATINATFLLNVCWQA